MFPDGWFDCTQTISTLPEMPRPQAVHYLDLLSAKSGRAVFFKQWKELRNNADTSELAEPDYALPSPGTSPHAAWTPFNQASSTNSGSETSHAQAAGA